MKPNELNIPFSVKGLTEKIEIVNAALENLLKAEELLNKASQISVDVSVEDSLSQSES